MSEYQEVEIMEPADATLPKSRLTRGEASAVVRSTVGARFKQARELNGWNQREAAVRMGYENGTQLSLIEAGRRNTPLAVFCVASTVYGVSVDFLLGLSSEPERDPAAAERHAMLRQVEGMLQEHAVQVLDTISTHMSAAKRPVTLARRVINASSVVTEAFRRFTALNDDAWQDLPGGAMLLKTMTELELVTHGALEALGKQERIAVFRTEYAAEPARTLAAISPAPRSKMLALEAGG